jgi:hypothetical protein
VQHRLEEEYPAIHRAAGREKAEIYWGDEAGFRSDHAAGTSYSPRGRTPIAQVTGKRFGGNMISAITNRGHLALMIFRGRFVTDVYLDFLRRLIRHARRKVYLIVDRHSVHSIWPSVCKRGWPSTPSASACSIGRRTVRN